MKINKWIEKTIICSIRELDNRCYLNSVIYYVLGNFIQVYLEAAISFYITIGFVLFTEFSDISVYNNKIIIMYITLPLITSIITCLIYLVVITRLIVNKFIHISKIVSKTIDKDNLIIVYKDCDYYFKPTVIKIHVLGVLSYMFVATGYLLLLLWKSDA